MASPPSLQQLHRELVEMDQELKGLMTMLDRGQTGRLFRPIVQLAPQTRERLRTRLDFARSLIIKLATLLSVPPEIPNFVDVGQSLVARHLGRLQDYSAALEREADENVGLQATQALQQLQDSLVLVRELLVPAEVPGG